MWKLSDSKIEMTQKIKDFIQRYICFVSKTEVRFFEFILHSCCVDSKLLEELADYAAFVGNHLIFEQMQHKSKVLPLESLLTQAINSDSPKSVNIVHKMMIKNGTRWTITCDMIQTAQRRGVTKIIETLTDVPYDVDNEKSNVKLSILSGEDKTIAGI